jgi:hypothetical protein
MLRNCISRRISLPTLFIHRSRIPTKPTGSIPQRPADVNQLCQTPFRPLHQSSSITMSEQTIKPSQEAIPAEEVQPASTDATPSEASQATPTPGSETPGEMSKKGGE